MANDKSKLSKIRLFFIHHSGSRISRLLDPIAIKPLLTQMWILPKSGLHVQTYSISWKTEACEKRSVHFFIKLTFHMLQVILVNSGKERRQWHVAAPERLSSCWIKGLKFEHYHQHSSNLYHPHSQGIIVFK